MSGVYVPADRRRQRFRRDDGEARCNQRRNLVPRNRRTVEPKADPTASPDVRRQIEPRRPLPYQITVLAETCLHADRHDAIAVMIIEKVGKDLLANAERGMRSLPLDGGFGEREKEPGETGKRICPAGP